MLNYHEEIVARLKKHNLTISTCESVTGGMISSYIVAVPGASQIFRGGHVTYSPESKIRLVGVKEETIAAYSVVSSHVAREMAIGTQRNFRTDLVVSITGNAGPKTDHNQPIGQAFMCVLVLEKLYTFELNSKQTSRNDIRLDLTVLAFKTILNLLDEIRCQ